MKAAFEELFEPMMAATRAVVQATAAEALNTPSMHAAIHDAGSAELAKLGWTREEYSAELARRLRAFETAATAFLASAIEKYEREREQAEREQANVLVDADDDVNGAP